MLVKPVHTAHARTQGNRYKPLTPKLMIREVNGGHHFSTHIYTHARAHVRADNPHTHTHTQGNRYKPLTPKLKIREVGEGGFRVEGEYPAPFNSTVDLVLQAPCSLR